MKRGFTVMTLKLSSSHNAAFQWCESLLTYQLWFHVTFLCSLNSDLQRKVKIFYNVKAIERTAPEEMLAIPKIALRRCFQYRQEQCWRSLL